MGDKKHGIQKEIETGDSRLYLVTKKSELENTLVFDDKGSGERWTDTDLWKDEGKTTWKEAAKSLDCADSPEKSGLADSTEKYDCVWEKLKEKFCPYSSSEWIEHEDKYSPGHTRKDKKEYSLPDAQRKCFEAGFDCVAVTCKKGGIHCTLRQGKKSPSSEITYVK